MAQSLASIPYVGEAGGLRDWGAPAYAGEIPSLEIWSWRPVAATNITQVLSAWRAAERQLQDLLEASPMRTLVRFEVARLRAEYQDLFARAMR